MTFYRYYWEQCLPVATVAAVALEMLVILGPGPDGI